MRIGIDARFYGPTHAGLGRYTKNLVDQLAQIESPNHFVIFLHPSNVDQFSTDNPRFEKQIIDASHYSVKEQLLLPRLLSQAKLDLVHFPHLNVPVGYRGPYVVTIHDLIMHKFRNRAVTTHIKPLYEAKHLGYRAVTRWAATHAKAIIVPSHAVKDELIEFYHLPATRVHVTYESADDVPPPPTHISDRQKSDILAKYQVKTPFIVYVGNVYPHKNIELVAKALPELHKKFGLNLVLPSARSVFLDRTEAMMEQYSVREYVSLPGFVPDDDLQILFSQATAYVFPSLAEGFGLPPLMAMIAGLPVVCSNIPVLKEICADAALYFDPHNPEELVNQLAKLEANPALRQTLIDRGYQRVKQFSWQLMAEETLEIYEKVGSATM